MLTILVLLFFVWLAYRYDASTYTVHISSEKGGK